MGCVTREDVWEVLPGTYTLGYGNSVLFLEIDYDTELWSRYLILTGNKFCYLYTYESNKFIYYLRHTSSPENLTGSLLRGITKITATSYLREFGRSYSTNSIHDWLDDAWAEGVPGQGINEKLFIEGDFSSLYISIGYVSYEKPQLYTENSRPKKIRISYENEFSFDVDLVDTPNFQTINLPNQHREKALILEILEVYPGTKYQDTCINSILGYYNP